MADINAKNTLAAKKIALDAAKLQVDKDNQANDLAIAKINAKGRNKPSK
jgi:hypothetical protein